MDRLSLKPEQEMHLKENKGINVFFDLLTHSMI